MALVIGNGQYADRPLKNPGNDARDLADALRKAGFEVTLKQNLEADQMKDAIADFGDRLARERSVGLFYFSGHGMQTSKGNNYLLPVGRPYRRERDVEFYAVEARSVLSQMEAAGNPLNIVVLDACRDAPLPPEARSSSSKGLARMDAPSGSIIAFATAPGRTASDNPSERNGLYTKHLIAALNTPGLRLEDVFKEVGRNVERESNRQQSPEEMMKLRDTTPFYFTPGASPPPPQPAPPYLVTPPAPAQDPAEAAYWAEVARSDDPDYYAAYLATYPQGRHVADANEYLNRDKQAKAAKEKLREDQAWQKAQSGDSHASYEAYLKAYPNGRYAALAKLKQSKLRPPFEPEMVQLPGGGFQMGSPSGETGRAGDEGPQHWVDVAAFQMSKTEITRGQFAAFVNDSGHDAGDQCWTFEDGKYEQRSGRNWRNPGYSQRDDHPVVCVNWHDAQAYAQWLSRKTGQHYRLPTEAEWEYAARAGSTTARPWGDEANRACGHANVADQTAKNQITGASGWTIHNCTDSHAYTAPVASFTANAFGLHDMIGNVWEWTGDCWNGDYSGAPTDGSAWTGGDCERRVLRGGSWVNGPGSARSAIRIRNTPAIRFVNIGFRLARGARTH